jgi:phosphoribosylanthranilate isomerase
MKLKIKICGMRDTENILKVSALRPDIMGFIFYRSSPRYAGDMLDAKTLFNLPSSVLKAGVFVNEDEKLISDTVERFKLDMVQLHGDETPDLCRRLNNKNIKVIKVFSMSLENPFSKCSQYTGVTDYFLFDTPATGSGGAGSKFDWKVLNEYDLQHPFFLSGGISPEDTDRIGEIKNPSFSGIDLNSRFEISSGIKNTEMLKNFISDIRKKY